MSVQTLHTNSIPSSGMGGFLRFFKLALVAVMTFSLAACLPSGEQNVNTELFKDKQEIAQKEGVLKPGMTKAQVFETLGIPKERFERMSMQEMQYSVYGQSVVQGTPEQLEQFRNRMMSYEGYSLPYRNIKASSSLGFGNMKVKKTGHDLRLVLIFEKNKLCKSAVEGTQNVVQEDSQSLWNTIVMRGIGAAF